MRYAKRVLLAAAELVESGWCQGVEATDAEGWEVSVESADAERFSLTGALDATKGEEYVDYQEDTVQYRMRQVIPVHVFTFKLCAGIADKDSMWLKHWNDEPGRTKEQVLTVLREAANLTRAGYPRRDYLAKT